MYLGSVLSHWMVSLTAASTPVGIARPRAFNHEIATLDVTEVTQSLKEGLLHGGELVPQDLDEFPVGIDRPDQPPVVRLKGDAGLTMPPPRALRDRI
jgi:hypothetical protein